jgi:hypothetical protein
MSTPKSETSHQSEDPEIEFNTVKQVKALYEELIDRHANLQEEIETYEVIDDDIQELREKTLDKYELSLLAEAYEAAGEKTTAAGLRNQSEDCDERIEELQSNLEHIDVKEHTMTLYELEIKRDTYEIQMKACEIYLKKCKQRNYVDNKKQSIRPASPRRYPKAASPSRLTTAVATQDKSSPNNSPQSSPVRKEETTSSKPQLPKLSLLPLPPPPKK